MAFMAPDCKNPENLDWLVVEPPTPLKNDGVKVSWDDELPNMMEKIKAIFQTTTQYVCMYVYIYSMFNAF